MERIIKFRAWDTKSNRMRGLSGLSDMFSIRSDGKTEDRYILMQFTGLTDKNGLEIYEGDILKAAKVAKISDLREKEYVGVVEYDSKTAQWFIKTARGFGYSFFQLYEDFALEVIGNVFETPELLTAK